MNSPSDFIFLDSDDDEVPFDSIDEYLAGTFKKKCKLENNDYYLSIMSIDIGILHLGISISLIDKEYNIIEVIWVDLINITEFKCQKGCDLWHKKTYSDWLSHVFDREYDFFDMVDIILIERQPPQGMTGIEQIIFYQWRDKAVLISPRSVHSHFYMGELNYDQRKIASERIARKYIPQHLQEQMKMYNRVHDITDSLLFTKFWCDQRKKRMITRNKNRRKKRAEKRVNKNLGIGTFNDFFDIYRYIPSDTF